MAIKVYKEGYQVVVDATGHLQGQVKEKTYTTATKCRYGFDSDTCWIKDIVGNKYIYNDDVSNMVNAVGVPVGGKNEVEDYLLSFIGDSNSSKVGFNLVENGTFSISNSPSDAPPWTLVTWAVIDEQLKINTGLSNRNFQQPVFSESQNGKVFTLSYEIVSITTGSIALRSTSFAGYLALDSTLGVKTVDVTAINDNLDLVFVTIGGSGAEMIVDNISLVEKV